MARINTDWERKGNFREGKAITETRPFAAAWMPPADADTLVAELQLVARDETDEDFLRPPPASPLATQGCGGQFPTYVGANAPAGASAFDWTELLTEVLREQGSITTR